jgi:Tol biopolymer transport system component
MFSPDGNFLLISETTSATGSRLFVVDLNTSEQRLVQSPGLSMDTEWYMPSWRK